MFNLIIVCFPFLSGVPVNLLWVTKCTSTVRKYLFVFSSSFPNRCNGVFMVFHGLHFSVHERHPCTKNRYLFMSILGFHVTSPKF